MRKSKSKIKRVTIIAAVALLAVATTSSPVSAANKEGGKCSKVGAKTKSGPSVALVCSRVGKTLKWKKVSSSRGKCGATAFTHAPFNAADVAIITNGEETNDARFAYVWLKNPSTPMAIYAPADGVLVTIRHLTANNFFPSDDYQLVFNLSLTCNDYFRFNHFTAPRADIKAAYQYGNLCSSCFDDNGNPTARYEEREIPKVKVAVKAGDLLGYTTGTPNAHDWDFAIQISDKTVCPFSVLAEPHKTTLLNLLGPKSATPSGPPTPGYACKGYGARG
ncbi:MAG: hypothetical protein ACYC06_06640 [Ilumatobacteraceae bacterium]